MKFELDFFSELFTRFKSYSISAFNFDLFPGLWISALAGFAINIAKCAEANQGHLAVSFLQAFCHPINEWPPLPFFQLILPCSLVPSFV
jgi:hypothetical protein